MIKLIFIFILLIFNFFKIYNLINLFISNILILYYNYILNYFFIFINIKF